MEADTSDSFFQRHDFLIRRLHSLAGLVPVGAYMVVHLLTNASVLNGAATFQKNVYSIHALGSLLPLVEWTFIFLPILFHGIVGLIITRESLPNNGAYPYVNNVRYTLQRATGMIAFLFIGWHVFHMHGWFHADWWLDNVAKPFAGAQFSPYNAASTGAEAMQQSVFVPVLYGLGVLACVFHFANGLWTMGITWGLWITPAAQKRADILATVVGVIVLIAGLSAVVGFARLDPAEARKTENRMYESRVSSGELEPNEHKRAGGHAPHDEHEQASAAGQEE